MPHTRARHLSQWIKHYLKASPSLCLIGQRQTGKTTLIQSLAKKEYRLDRESVRADLERNLQSRLESGPFPLLLDEAQKLPALFDEIKASIDEKKIPGRYLLTGSVRLSSKKSIRESLTGRTLVLELLPLGLAETHHRPLSPIWDWLFDQKNPLDHSLLLKIQKQAWAHEKDLFRFLGSGGLPGICFQRDSDLRNELFQSHLDTLLGRDLSTIHASKLSQSKLSQLLILLAEQQGEPLNLSQLARKVGTTSPTIKAHLQAFEALFLVRELGKSYYFEDQGMASFLQSHQPALPQTEMRRLIFSELQQQLHYRYRRQVKLNAHQPKRGIQIPFVLTPALPGRPVAIMIEGETVASQSSLKAMSWFLKKKPRTIGLILHLGKTPLIHSPQTLSLPAHWVF